MRWAGHAARMRREMHTPFLLENLKGPRSRLENNIKEDLKEIGYEGVNWINLVQDRDQWRGACEHDNEPSGSMNCCEFFDQLGDSQFLKDSAPLS